ncbi:MAG: hypothetical protein II970_02160 [Paludibacteraceae bacterium]|nr:hypothetical protein [Paludibacteraceae bacterium]
MKRRLNNQPKRGDGRKDSHSGEGGPGEIIKPREGTDDKIVIAERGGLGEIIKPREGTDGKIVIAESEESMSEKKAERKCV